MKSYFVKKSTLKGEIVSPSSKSQTMRAILFASIASGQSKIKNFLKTDDILAFIDGCKKFGAKIKVKKNNLEILGTNKKIKLKKNVILDVKNSGIALRFLTAIYALGDKNILVTGDESICSMRSMKPLITSLNELGAKITSKKMQGFAPLDIKGPFKGGSIKIDAKDSQHISSLLIAASLLKDPMKIEAINPKEKPWVALTLEWLDKLNIKYENYNFEKYVLYPAKKIAAFEYLVPTDFSTILFPIVASLITKSEISIKDVVFDVFQKDQKTIEIFQKLGAKIEIDKVKQEIRVKKSHLQGNLDLDVDDFIDSVPILAVFGCFNDGKIVLKNAQNAKTKESNRLSTITVELKKMGAKIKETKDGLEIEKSILKPAIVNSHKDHRIALSLVIASLGTDGTPCVIEDIDCISKTYPNFKKDFQTLKAKVL
ncbi:MAG: 3-phosphoshikimate 1-carboxyvinyltransferase [Candidatus Anoxychlamydiales bacterium]|nr:3-phosphoshikimate 1-carboxyvinyltransferase [Candidatus Anoxychlamydiales bacterium]NGX35500.1 3-phosphoshikimate 1-carboxyvinyltransferase [Candidatus Anoxychlamydiales bacterium]